MKKLLFLCLLVVLSYQISKEKLRGKQNYKEEKREPGQFKKLKYCKINKCITSNEMKEEIARNAKDGGDESPAFKKKQQKCFYECQMQYCAAKHPHGNHDCKHDEDGLEYKPIFDENDPQFHDYAPTEQELDEYLAINNDPLVRKFKEKHYQQKE